MEKTGEDVGVVAVALHKQNDCGQSEEQMAAGREGAGSERQKTGQELTTAEGSNGRERQMEGGEGERWGRSAEDRLPLFM